MHPKTVIVAIAAVRQAVDLLGGHLLLSRNIYDSMQLPDLPTRCYNSQRDRKVGPSNRLQPKDNVTEAERSLQMQCRWASDGCELEHRIVNFTLSALALL